jgi:hypothetical protein
LSVVGGFDTDLGFEEFTTFLDNEMASPGNVNARIRQLHGDERRIRVFQNLLLRFGSTQLLQEFSFGIAK